MKTILYVSAHNPYPALSGGQVDTWNRLQSLREMGLAVHMVLTVKTPLAESQSDAFAATVDRLTVVQRTSMAAAVLGSLPVQMAVRSRLRKLDLGDTEYDLALLDNEFCGELLANPTLRAHRIAVRVQNDEAAYQCKLAETETRFMRRQYFRMEARRMAHYIPDLWKKVDALWFISSDELSAFRAWAASEPDAKPPSAKGCLLPAGVNLALAGRPLLHSGRVLFVGSLAVTLNRDAIRWYLANVHPLLLDQRDYEFVVAGSTLGQDLADFCREIEAHSRVSLRCNVPDLQSLFDTSSVFVSPMRFGAGVKLKTVEAALRGLPLVTTSVGAEGSGLLHEVHCLIADEAADFAKAVRRLLGNPEAATLMRDQATEYICHAYNQGDSLRLAMQDLHATASAD